MVAEYISADAAFEAEKESYFAADPATARRMYKKLLDKEALLLALLAQIDAKLIQVNTNADALETDAAQLDADQPS